MKSFALLLLCTLIAACAGQPQPASHSQSQSQSRSPTASTVAATSGDNKLTGEKIVALQREGYKIVDRDGQQLFCRTEKKTGTQITRETVCMTEKEMESLRELTQRRLGEISRERTPPPGK